MRKKQCVAMLLAGGQGSRLGILTKDVAKPAVPYGGKYRIIDFPLSNCTNSGIDVVGVLTQYRPLELNAYIGYGQPWGLNSRTAAFTSCRRIKTGKTSEWYKGTANAIYQNIRFIAQWEPDYVLVLSGDHIYKMDYNAMLHDHIKNGADLTIAVREVPWEEAPRFGILNTDENNRITEFEEKPAQPKSNKASMGVYIFSWSKMRKYLELDEANPNSSNDFGKRADGAKVVNCLITEGCEVKGVINHSVLFAGVTVETGAEITDAVIMPGAVIERGAVVRRAIVAENAHICAGAVVGEETGKIAVIGHNAVIPAGDKVAAGVQVDAGAQQ